MIFVLYSVTLTDLSAATTATTSHLPFPGCAFSYASRPCDVRGSCDGLRGLCDTEPPAHGAPPTIAPATTIATTIARATSARSTGIPQPIRGVPTKRQRRARVPTTAPTPAPSSAPSSAPDTASSLLSVSAAEDFVRSG